jgi:hypothetical protein
MLRLLVPLVKRKTMRITTGKSKFCRCLMMKNLRLISLVDK